jgi:hypothetical protein
MSQAAAEDVHEPVGETAKGLVVLGSVSGRLPCPCQEGTLGVVQRVAPTRWLAPL